MGRDHGHPYILSTTVLSDTSSSALYSGLLSFHTGVLIWRYGAACSSFKIFAAPAAQNAAPGGVKDMGVAEWRKAVDRLY